MTDATVDQHHAETIIVLDESADAHDDVNAQEVDIYTWGWDAGGAPEVWLG